MTQLSTAPTEEAEDAEARVDAEYGAVVPTDAVLVERFEAHFHRHPEAYGPIGK